MRVNRNEITQLSLIDGYSGTLLFCGSLKRMHAYGGKYKARIDSKISVHSIHRLDSRIMCIVVKFNYVQIAFNRFKAKCIVVNLSK